MTDPISDLLTRIRNAQNALHESTLIPFSRMKEDIIRVLVSEGFLKGYEVIGEGVRKQLSVQLKYVGRREPLIAGLKRVSKPGRRVYCGATEAAGFRTGMGMAILSTPNGVLTDRQAREQVVGGEVLCQVW